MAYNASNAVLNAFVPTKSDTAKISGFGFYASGGTQISVMPSAQENTASPTAVTFPVPTGGLQIRDFCISRVMSTNTDATTIIVFGPT